MLRCLRKTTDGLLTGRTSRTYAAGWKALRWKHDKDMLTFYPMVLVKRPTIRVRRMRPRDVPHVIRLFQESFSANEPLVSALQMPQDRYSPVLEELWRNAIDHGMSFVAVPNKVSNTNVLGAVINTKICPWDPDQIEKLSSCILCPKTKDLLNLWAFFFKDSEIFSRYKNAKIFNIAHVIINEEKSKRHCSDLTSYNLANLLVNKSIRFANTKGFNMACLICTGDFLSNVATNVGMDLFWRHHYKQFLNEKLDPLLKIERPNTEVKLFIQQLSETEIEGVESEKQN